ncbi:MAG: Omp28-related outer membrane protein [Muribaculaceae bacterium]|nr:Omp28-related outer membrane protein [Muribaculaceae bacterium]
MKRLFVTFIAWLIIYGMSHAQNTEFVLGYCGGEEPQSTRITYSESGAMVSAAIYIPVGTLSTCAGNEITGVRAALASKLNITELTVWLRQKLDGENLVEGNITNSSDPKLSKGWNTVKFNSTWQIPAEPSEGIYIGYSYVQKGSAMGIGLVDYPAANGCFIKLGNGSWENRSSQNVACIEGLVSGDNIPELNLSLLNISFPEVFVIDKEVAKIDFTVQNKALRTVTGFDIEGYINGVQGDRMHINCNIPFNSVETFSVTMPLGISDVGNGQAEFTMKICEVYDGEDEDMTDNELTTVFQVRAHDFARRILVEEFTSESCPSCPRVGEYISEALAKEEFKDVIVVCHHSGFKNDWLTTSFDNSYTWFYNGGTYAPAMMVDREEHADGSAVWNPTTLTDMEQAWRKAQQQPAFIVLNIKAQWNKDESSLLDIVVEGEKAVADLCANPYITIWLVEDNIEAIAQSNATDWVHQHTNRAVNNTWGDPVIFEGDTYTYSCSMYVASSWKIEDLKIVAFIANYNGENPLDCEIMNAASINCPVTSAAIDSIEAPDMEAEYYTLQGIRISNPENGIFICKKGSKVKKVVIK